MSILITGGTGSLGAFLAKRMLDSEENIILFDAKPNYKIISDILPRVQVFSGDVTNWTDLVQVVEENKVQKIFHLSALLSSPCEDNPYRGFKVNVEGTVNVLEVCRLFGINKLLFPSTVSTFGRDADEPVEEASPQHPTNIYGVTKVVGEKWGIYYWHKYGIDFRAIRFPRIVNPGRQGTGAALFPSSMIQKATLGKLHQEEVSQDYRVPLLYVKDAVEALLLLDKAKDVPSRIYNMEGLLPTAKEIAEILKHKLPRAQINFPEKAKPTHLKIPLHFASEKIKKELGWQIKYPLREMIEDFIKEVQTRRQLYVDNQE